MTKKKRQTIVAGSALAGGATVAGATVAGAAILKDLEVGMTSEVTPEEMQETVQEEKVEPEELAILETPDQSETPEISETPVETETVSDSLLNEAAEMDEPEAAEPDSIPPAAPQEPEPINEEDLVSLINMVVDQDAANLMEQAPAPESVAEPTTETVGEAELQEAVAAAPESPAEPLAPEPIDNAAEPSLGDDIRWTPIESEDPLPPEEELAPEDLSDLIDTTAETGEETVSEEDLAQTDLLDKIVEKADEVLQDIIGTNDEAIPDFENNADVKEFL